MTMLLPILYTFRRCPYAMRARLALDVAEIDVEFREIKLAQKPAQMLAISPKGTVPVLQLPDGQVLEESLEIAFWALRQHDPERWLEVEDRNQATALIAANDGPFKRHLDHYKYATRYPGSEAQQEREAASFYLAALEDILARQAWLAADHLTYCDALVFPFIRQFSLVEPIWFAQAFPALAQ